MFPRLTRQQHGAEQEKYSESDKWLSDESPKSALSTTEFAKLDFFRKKQVWLTLSRLNHTTRQHGGCSKSQIDHENFAEITASLSHEFAVNLPVRDNLLIRSFFR